METEEIRSAYIRHDTDEWTELAFQVMVKVLVDRDKVLPQEQSFPENPSDVTDLEASDSEDNEESKPPLDLSRINWQEDSVEAIYYELCKRTLLLGDMEPLLTEPKSSQQIEDDRFNCVQCGESISWFERTCPNCHLELFPQTSDQSQVAENIQSELAAELAPLSTDKLLDIWYESDPMEWDREEMADLRAAFAKHGFLPPYMLDAAADLVNRLPYLTIEELSLRGWPGYRNRPGRCGLDPLDRNAEEGFIVGKMLRALFTLKMRTTNGFYINLMLVYGVILTFPIICLFSDVFSIGWFFLPYILVGIMLLLNAGLSVLGPALGYEYSNEEPPFFPPE